MVCHPTMGRLAYELPDRRAIQCQPVDLRTIVVREATDHVIAGDRTELLTSLKQAGLSICESLKAI